MEFYFNVTISRFSILQEIGWQLCQNFLKSVRDTLRVFAEQTYSTCSEERGTIPNFIAKTVRILAPDTSITLSREVL